MKVERINEYQHFSLIVLFEIGSTTLFARGIEVKQDAWIAILIAMLMGLYHVMGLYWNSNGLSGQKLAWDFNHRGTQFNVRSQIFKL